MKNYVMVILMTLGFSAGAAETNPHQKIVEAFQGTWEGSMLSEVPPKPDESFAYKMVCREVAAGKGVECTASGQASIGEVTQTCVIGFDEGSRRVHQMCVNSMGVIDHLVGSWVSDELLRFDPSEKVVRGEKITEKVEVRLTSAGQMVQSTELTSEKELPMTFIFEGHRQTL